MKQILIDAGHGINTAGKRSPDGRFLEYRFNREIAASIVQHLQYRGYDAKLLVPEEEDIPLPERVRRANGLTCRPGHPVQDTVIVSIHANAAGHGDRWMNARGWCAYTYYGHSESDRLATCLYEAARKHLPGQRLRTDYTDGDPDIEAAFYILKYTYTTAVLSENLFYDNSDDLAFLESEEGKKAIVALHVEGIISFLSA